MQRIPFILTIIWFVCTIAGCKHPVTGAIALRDTPGDSLSVMNKWCSTCHLSPGPELLTKKIWRENVLPNMGFRLGIKQAGYSPVEAYDMMEQTLVSEAKVYPDSALISNNDWTKISAYIISHAPDSLKAPLDTTSFLNEFVIKPMGELIQMPMVTLLNFDSVARQFHIGHESGVLFCFDKEWKRIDSIHLHSTPIDYVATGEGGLILTIGRMYPSERKLGSLLQYGNGHFHKILDALHRPVSITMVDMNGDHLDDALISEFGFETGRLAWFEGSDTGMIPIPRILKNTAGAVKCLLKDMDDDGIKDVIVLMAQGDEHISVYKMDKSGIHHEYKVLRFPPVHGVCDMDIMDVNRDGLPDLIVANGDNADYSQVIKPYHGITIYLNKGSFLFEQSAFLPYPGVLHCLADDFDQDGDIDIAATSFFPGDDTHPYAPFKYFENRSGIYIGKTFQGSTHGKWMEMIRGDFDLDGDQDILLGSFLLNNIRVSGTREELKRNGLVLLVNKTRHNIEPIVK